MFGELSDSASIRAVVSREVLKEVRCEEGASYYRTKNLSRKPNGSKCISAQAK